MDAGPALAIQLENAGIKRDQLDLRRGATLAQRIGIAALADFAALAVAPVDELTVEIAQIDARLRLPKK